MKHFAIAAALTASLASFTISVARASTFDFQFVSPGVAAIGQFTVDPTTQEVTGISGSVSIDGQPDDTITSILADPDFPSGYNNGPFIYDNLFLGGNPVFDINGVAFATSGNPGGSWNLWGNGPDNYSLYESVPNVGYSVQATGTLAVFPSEALRSATSAPEPSSWAMMLMGFTGLGYVGLRRGRAGRPARSIA